MSGSDLLVLLGDIFAFATLVIAWRAFRWGKKTFGLTQPHVHVRVDRAFDRATNLIPVTIRNTGTVDVYIQFVSVGIFRSWTAELTGELLPTSDKKHIVPGRRLDLLVDARHVAALLDREHVWRRWAYLNIRLESGHQVAELLPNLRQVPVTEVN